MSEMSFHVTTAPSPSAQRITRLQDLRLQGRGQVYSGIGHELLQLAHDVVHFRHQSGGERDVRFIAAPGEAFKRFTSQSLRQPHTIRWR